MGDSPREESLLRKRRLEDEEAPVGSSKAQRVWKHQRLAPPVAGTGLETSKGRQGDLSSARSVSSATGVAVAAVNSMVGICEPGVIANVQQQLFPPTCREAQPIIGPFVYLTDLNLLVCT
jgi:hypothetical protein